MKRFAATRAALSTTLSTALLTAVLAITGCRASDTESALATIQAAGGTVNRDHQGQVVSVDLSDTAATDEELAAIGVLPSVRTINCTNARQIKGATLRQLGGLKNLETLYLVGTDVTDASLAGLEGLTSLKTLHLGRTRITDAGMPVLDHLTNLQTLSLGNTEVTDMGLVQLRDLRHLSTLILRKTKVTSRGVQELQRMLPDTRIED
ncbi:MAG: leucine-rich repeat domain-containing protein [Pirellulales bacterium]